MNPVPKYCDRDLEEAWLLQRKLRAVLSSAQLDKPGAQSLQEVTQLCDRALLALPDELFHEKLCEVERYAVDFLSADRSARRDRGATTPGAVVQRRLILAALEAIHERLERLETLSRAGDVLSRAGITSGKS